MGTQMETGAKHTPGPWEADVPELLEALEGLERAAVAEWGPRAEESRVILRARAAIAKARGE